VVVGDDPRSDIAGGRAAGLRTVFCSRYARVPAEVAGADACIDALEQLRNVL
jgi:phosphoglycolate phosphatase-like HAD superfamily hydrolase